MPQTVWDIIVNAQSNLPDLQTEVALLKTQLNELSTLQVALGGDPSSESRYSISRNLAGQARVTQRYSEGDISYSRVIGDQARAAREAELLAAAQERAGMAEMGRGQKIDFLTDKLTTLSTGTREYYDTQAKLNSLLIQERNVSAREATQLAASQEKAALSGMNYGQQLSYLKDKLSTLNPASREYFETQTKINQVMHQAEVAGSRYNQLLLKMAASMIVWEGFRYVTETIREVVEAQREYSLETARFAAITEQSVGQATQAWNEYANIAAKAGVKPMEAAPVFRVAQLTPGETDETRQQFVRTVTQLEELTGVSSAKIGEGLSSALRQAGKGLENVQHMGDLVATTLSRIPAAKIDDVIAALQEAAPLAQLWGVEFDQAFNIIVEGAARVQESPEQVSTAFQRLSKGLNSIAEGGAKAWERQSKIVDEFGINIEGADKKLRPIPEILGEIARLLPTLSAPRQQALLEAVAGGSLRPEQMRNILGGLEAFNADLSGSVDKLNGTLDRMTTVIDQSLGQVVKVLDARIEQLKDRGDILSNIVVSILRGTLGQWGGKQGAQLVSQGVEANLGITAVGPSQREGFISQIAGQSGGNVDVALRLAREHNQRVGEALASQMGQLNPIQQLAASSYANSIRISDEEIVEAIKEGQGKIRKASSEGLDASDRHKASVNIIEAARATTRPMTLMDRIGAQARRTLLIEGGDLTGESLKMGRLDASKYTQDEVNRAKELATQLAQQEIEAQRELLTILGLQPEEIAKVVKAMQDEIDSTITLVQYQDKVKAEFGAQGKFLQDALQQMDKMEQQQKSNFQFRRLKDVDPSQFGQLQQLAQMYDRFLTNIGSPEKQMNINLLMGENNTFKTMNARMTALQLALEDLTKVEKAQLSGTWNLPSGATALVPISSLDLQRWNKSGGGGLSEEAIRALLGPVERSGDKVSESTQMAATRIIEAIYNTALKAGIATDKIQQAKTIPEAVTATREELLSRVGMALAMKEQIDAEMRRTLGVRSPAREYEDAAERDFRLRQLPAAEQATSVLKSTAQAAQVTVSALPIKAVFNANVAVMMNGAVVARAILPILYQLLTKMTASTGTRPKGTQR